MYYGATISIYKSQEQYKIKIADYKRELKDQVYFPGITICAPTIITPKLLSKFYPKFATFMNENVNKQSESVYKTFKYYESKMLSNYSIKEIIYYYSARMRNVIRSCRYNPLRYRYMNKFNEYIPELNCDSLSAVLSSIFAGKNVGHFSNLYGKLVLQMSPDYNPAINIDLDLGDDQWKNLADPNEIGVAIHPPEILPEMKNFVYFKLKRNYMLEVSFTKKIFNETGYNLNCRNYNDEDILYKLFGTHDGCINSCINQNFFQDNFCYSYFHMITITRMVDEEMKFRICPHEKQDYLRFLRHRNHCLSHSSCRKECVNNELDIDFHLTRIQPPNGTNSFARIHIRLSTIPYKIYSYRNLMTNNEVFGINGGHMGLWLGLSVIVSYNVIADYIIPFLKLLFCIIFLLKSIFFIVHMNHTDAIEADFPAITICAPSILSPKNMSGYDPNFANFLMKYEKGEFKNCPKKIDMSDDWRHNIPNVSCSSFKCSHTGLDKDIVYFSDWENLYRMYKRIYSRMIAELNPEINIEIEATDDDWKFMNVDGLFTVAIHKSNVLPSIEDFVQYSIVNNHRLDIGFTMTNLNIVNKNTNSCLNYNDGSLFTSYRNRDECIRICILGQFFIANFTCHYYFPPVILEHLYGGQKQLTVCPHDQQNYLRYLQTRQLCQFRCDEECQQEKLETYSLSTKFSGKLTGKTYAQIRVHFTTYPIKSIRYRKIINDNEFMAMIGGHLGLWLGLSVMTFIKIYLKFCVFLLRSCIKMLHLHRIAKYLLKHFD
ncbi:hypothetical protein HUG17_4676 [Dermatophagoides farinae]|uniref:Uncharacterized protein n=1 Tax=Dermatophagoides farinae TaxID=6954 RepID=A0A9D4SHB1_DERFA|nr:hypothetical protein HUG17_4676 [Dermatophagoides farinae]